MAKIHLSRIKSSVFKISSYAGPSVQVRITKYLMCIHGGGGGGGIGAYLYQIWSFRV